MNVVNNILEKTGVFLKTCTYILIVTAISFIIPDIKEFLFPSDVCTRCTSCDEDSLILQNPSDVEVDSDEDSGFEKIDLSSEKIQPQRSDHYGPELTSNNALSNIKPIPRMEIAEIEKICGQQSYFCQQGDFNQLKKESITAVRSHSQNVVDWIFPFLKKD